MPVEGILSNRVETCRPEDTLAQVAQKMTEHGVDLLPVIADDGRVISIITDLDIAIAASIEGRKLIDLTVGEAIFRELAVGAGTATTSARAQRPTSGMLGTSKRSATTRQVTSPRKSRRADSPR